MEILPIIISVGAPVLVALFCVEGLIVGKLLQPPIGQWTLYHGFNEESSEWLGLRRHVPYLDALPSIVQPRISENRLDFVERQFDSYGGYAICLTNTVPGIRGLISYSRRSSSRGASRMR